MAEQNYTLKLTRQEVNDIVDALVNLKVELESTLSDNNPDTPPAIEAKYSRVMNLLRTRLG